MSTSQQPSSHSRTDRFMRGAGIVDDTKLWGPAKWVVQLIQYMIAIVMVTMAEGVKAIFTGEKPQRRRDGDGKKMT